LSEQLPTPAALPALLVQLLGRLIQDEGDILGHFDDVD